MSKNPNGASHPTINDVAAHAGVSPMTVSRVLAGGDGVKRDKVKLVQQAVAALGYRRNENARSLRPGQRTGLVGVVITNLSNPYYGEVQRGLDDVLSERGMRLLAGNTNEDPARERRLVEDFVGRQVDGLIVVPTGASQEHLSPAALGFTPLVLASRQVPGLDADAVLIDDINGSRQAVANIIAQGHRRIAFVANVATVSTSQRRLDGFREAHRAAGLVPDPSLIRLGQNDPQLAKLVTLELMSLPEPPTAIFAANNRNAVGVMRALFDFAGPDVADLAARVEVISFDDFEFSDLMPFPLTVIDHDGRDLGQRSARMLLGRLDEDPSNRRPTQLVQLPTTIKRLVPRDRHALLSPKTENGDVSTVSSYDKTPMIPLPSGRRIMQGPAVWQQVRAVAAERSINPVVVIDAYPGTDVEALIRQLEPEFDCLDVINAETAALDSSALDDQFGPNLTDDRVFGVMSHATIESIFDPAAVTALRRRIAERKRGVVLVGWGAAHIQPSADVVVLADMARWEIQLRYRAGMPNWHAANNDEDVLRKYKRGFFIEWRIADRHKRALFDSVDFVLDVNDAQHATMITGNTFRESLELTAHKPFRVVPYFDPGVWGGQWMKRVCGIDDDAPNYAWAFDGVPEENSLLLTDGNAVFQLPSIDLVFAHPRELLGQLTFARFGAEFPIRFDFLDTMGGGNLSLQVHPLTDYIQEKFGMSYTQDESYYMLDADDDAVVYLGVKEGVDKQQMLADLKAAESGTMSFPAEHYVNAFPAHKHDHFSIPAGTVHCSGANSMVLEISATPYIFTFKMWDWDRVGLDGVPRPVHVDHAMANIQWNRDKTWAKENLVGQVQQLASGEGWVEERTGLHELEFIEVRRHWFTGVVPHHTKGTVNVLNLVEGTEAIIESPNGAFTPFVVHYAETFIIPAAVRDYTIRPYGRGVGQRLATLKAYVRGTERPGD